MGKIILGYWNMRGLGERIRLMMEYMGIEYENVKYGMGGAPDYDLSSWHNVKYKLGLDFPNLPYIVDGSRKMTESWAIMRFIARKNSNQLYPEPGEQEIRCDVAVGVVHDFRTTFTKMIYDKDFENLKVKYRENLPLKLEHFEKFLKSEVWLAGDKLTYVDFAFAETLTRHQMMLPGCLDNFERLKKYHEDFLNLDKIATYYASDRFQKFPMHKPYAKWGEGP